MFPIFQHSIIPIFHLPLAAMEDLIWLIVGALWLVAQLAGSAAKKKRQEATENKPPAQKTAGDDPLANLLKQLTGAAGGEEEFQFEEEEEEFIPEPIKPVIAKPVFVPQNPWKRGEIEKLPDIQPLRRETPPPSQTPIEIPEIDMPVIRPKMSAFRSSIPTIKLPVMNLNFLSANTGDKRTSAAEKLIDPANRPALRRAMLSHIILSKPKAFEN